MLSAKADSFMGYQYYRSITVDYTKVPNTDQTDFPVLVQVTDASLATTANGGHVQNENGYDLVFAADPAAANLLAWEVESYDPVAGALLAWVNVPTLSHTTDTVIYLCYGNSATGTDQSNKTGVWDSNYKGVWHLGGDPTGTAPQEPDSTSNAQNGTAVTQGSAWSSSQLVPGAIGKALNFIGAQHQGIQIGTYSPIDGSSDFTLSIWCHIASYSSTNGYLIAKGADYLESSAYGIVLFTGGTVGFIAIPNGSYNQVAASSTPISTGAWHYVVATRSGTAWTLYIDGISAGKGTQSITINANNATKFQIGITDRANPYQYAFNGYLDEARVSNIARSADWIAAEYANQSSPSTFYSLGAEQLNKIIPAITWNTPDPIPQGTPLSITQLDATAPVAGTFVYNPPAGSVLSQGSQTLSATFTPADTADYAPATASVTLQIDPPYYPQFLSGMMAQAGYRPQVSFQTATQDVDCGLRTAFAWFSGGLEGYPPAPLYNWTVPYTMLTDADSQSLQSFFSQMKGSAGTFMYLDPSGNLCQYSEDFTQTAWAANNAAVSQSGGISDPFGGTDASTLTASAADASISTYVLPDGNASEFALCGSVWVKAAASQALQVGFTDDTGTLLQSQTWQLTAGIWTRISCLIVLTVNSKIKMQIGGGGTWANGAALSLYGAQCSPSLGPGAYAKTPENYGLHKNVRFDMETLVVTNTSYNQNSTTVKLREIAAGS